MSKDYSNDRVLLEELKRRSTKAYRYLYLNTRNRLYTLALSILQDEEAAKDLIQEFYTDLWAERLYENVNVSLKAYLYYAVRNRAFTYLKSMKPTIAIVEDHAKMD